MAKKLQKNWNKENIVQAFITFIAHNRASLES